MSQKLIESGAATWQEPASYHYSSIGWPSDGSVSSGCVTQMSVLFRMQRGRSTTVDWCVWRLTKLIDISVQESLHWWCSTSSCCARAKRRKRHPSGDDLEAQNRHKSVKTQFSLLHLRRSWQDEQSCKAVRSLSGLLRLSMPGHRCQM